MFRLVAGEKVTALSKELGVSEATLHLWKRQALIDAGLAEGDLGRDLLSPSHGKDEFPSLSGRSTVHLSRQDLSGCEERVHHRR